MLTTLCKFLVAGPPAVLLVLHQLVVDTPKLVALFGRKATTKSGGGAGAGSGAGAGGSKKKQKKKITSALDGKTQQNLGIMIARLRMSTPEVKALVRHACVSAWISGTKLGLWASTAGGDATVVVVTNCPMHRETVSCTNNCVAAAPSPQILGLDAEKFTAERVNVLLRMLPDPADVQSLAEYEGDKCVWRGGVFGSACDALCVVVFRMCYRPWAAPAAAKSCSRLLTWARVKFWSLLVLYRSELGAVDQFVLMMMSIPRLDKRLHASKFRFGLDQQIGKLRDGSARFALACKAVTTSDSFAYTMRLVLAVGALLLCCCCVACLRGEQALWPMLMLFFFLFCWVVRWHVRQLLERRHLARPSVGVQTWHASHACPNAVHNVQHHTAGVRVIVGARAWPWQAPPARGRLVGTATAWRCVRIVRLPNHVAQDRFRNRGCRRTGAHVFVCFLFFFPFLRAWHLRCWWLC